MMNIYEQAKKTMRNEEIDHHFSDLYLKVTETSRKLVDSYEYKNLVTTFICEIDKTLWYDIPFAYPERNNNRRVLK